MNPVKRNAKGGKKKMKRSSFAVIILQIFIIMFLTSCGREEYPETQMGIDGYVYASKMIQESVLEQAAALGGNYALGADINAYYDFAVSGDYLYYCRESYPNGDFRRLRISAGDTELKLAKGEILFKISYQYTALPKKISGLGQETEVFDLLKVVRRDAGSIEGSVFIPSHHTHYYFFLQDYVVDSEQNIYCMERLYTGTEEEMEENGGLLCRRREDGELVWQKYLSAPGDLAVDRAGNIFVLTENMLFTFDREGRQTEVTELKEYRMEGMTGTLIQADGYVYINILDMNLYESRIFAIGETCQLQEIKALSGNDYEYINTFGTTGGNLLLFHRSDGCVYEYDRESDSVQKLLRWEDSNLIKDKVTELIRINDDRMLARHSGTVYLLEKTPIEELPEMEIIVLASLNPEDDLRKAVTEFNRKESRYHVMIEEYGAGEDNAAAQTRLDGRLVSSNPPDLLDMADLDIYKYSKQGILDDLNILLEESSVLNREDFLENVLEGYTIDGRLVCIPRQYVGECIAGRASQLERLSGWTMEDIYELTEMYPESELFLWKDRDYLLRYFCSSYYLKEFVDWEEGSCSFESGDFCRLLEWIGKYKGREAKTNSSVPEDVLLSDAGPKFEDVCDQEVRFGEEICLAGVPGANGGGGVVLYRALDEVGIVSTALHKEGAVEFLEYYLSRPWDELLSAGNTTRRDFLQKMAKKAARSSQYVYDSNGEPKKDMYGNYITREATLYFIVDGEYIPYYQTPQRLVDQTMALIEKTDFTPRSQTEKNMIEIVMEEANIYFNGDKTVEETAAVIQHRVEILLKERAE